MEKLKYTDKINMGICAGETVKSCIKKYGRESVLDILKYYDLEDKVMEMCHYRKLHQNDSPEISEMIMNGYESCDALPAA